MWPQCGDKLYLLFTCEKFWTEPPLLGGRRQANKAFSFAQNPRGSGRQTQ